MLAFTYTGNDVNGELLFLA